jgi:hypothetical protein
MRLYPDDEALHESWKRIPLRIPGRSESSCCGVPTLLVESKQGGFVQRNCSKCNRPFDLPTETFFNELDLWFSCPECKQRMSPAHLEYGTYGYVCEKCNLGIRLSEILPRYQDLI